jgi:hypothetical protein
VVSSLSFVSQFHSLSVWLYLAQTLRVLYSVLVVSWQTNSCVKSSASHIHAHARAIFCQSYKDAPQLSSACALKIRELRDIRSPAGRDNVSGHSLPPWLACFSYTWCSGWGSFHLPDERMRRGLRQNTHVNASQFTHTLVKSVVDIMGRLSTTRSSCLRELTKTF